MKADEAYDKLAEMSGKANSKAFREILECAMMPEEAEFLLALPASHAELAANFEMDEKAKFNDEQIEGFINEGSKENLKIFKAIIEKEAAS